jgi:holo-[acyl-carrier protein] synthase
MNPFGLGVDIIEVSRIRIAVEQNPRILKRLFTDNELADYRDRGGRAETLAGKFAAKEAVLKALGTGLRGFPWTDLEILPDELGKPSCVFLRKAACKIDDLGISSVMISIAHNRTMATANALALKKENTYETGDQ